MQSPETRRPIAELLDEPKDFELCNQVFKRIGARHGEVLDLFMETEYERVVTTTWHASGIIGNGGFEYLFEGTFKGDPGYQLTLDSFRRIGCNKAAAAMAEALSCFPDGVSPADPDEATLLYLEVPEQRREELIEQFLQGDLERKLAAFIRENRSHFMHLR